MASLRAALIGTGQIASYHLACIGALPEVELAAVCDLSPALAESTAERFKVPAWYTDHHRMLQELRPDVVHVTTPPPTHFRLAMDALGEGAHVFVEKPITAVVYEDLVALADHADAAGRLLIEDYNYVFNSQIQRLLQLLHSSALGTVMHVEVCLCLDILSGGPFVDPHLAHPSLSMPGGAIADFLPHLAALAYFFVGPHRSVKAIWRKQGVRPSSLPSDELRALVDAERGTAELVFSAHTQPDAFWFRIYGTKMRAVANLFEPRLTIDRLRPLPRPLITLLNGVQESRDARRAAVRGLLEKLSGGPGSYHGLWELLGRMYRALGSGSEPPVSVRQVREINRLVADLVEGEEGRT